MKKQVYLLFALAMIIVLSFTTFCFASDIYNNESLEDNISYELNDYDANNEGVEDSFVPYTKEEMKKNQVETNFIKLKVLLMKHKYFSLFLVLVVIATLFAGLVKKRQKENL